MSFHITFEIAQGIYCLRVAPSAQFAYNSFLIVDERPILIHTGRGRYFEHTFSLAKSIIDVERIQYITFSHFEADECGALNQWLQAAPKAVTLVGPIGKSSIDDIADRPPVCISDNEIISLGKLELHVLETPHFPHGWDACVFYEPTYGILFCSDFGAQPGVGEMITTADLSKEVLDFQDKFGFLSEGIDFARGLERISRLPINTLATQHGCLLQGARVSALIDRMRTIAHRPQKKRTRINCGDF